MAFDRERIFIAASDELYAYTPDFQLIDSWRSPFLKHCHEICAWDRKLYLTSTGFDSVLRFDLDELQFDWALHIQMADYRFAGRAFDPMSEHGPIMLNRLHLNSVACRKHGMYITGMNSGGMLLFNGKGVQMAVELPEGTHNAQPFRNGVIFNDSRADVLRYTGRGDGEEDRAFPVPRYDINKLKRREVADRKVARQGFARGLCVLSDRVVAGGSSPSTITIYDLADNSVLGSVNLSMDIRNAIHGLEAWPYD